MTIVPKPYRRVVVNNPRHESTVTGLLAILFIAVTLVGLFMVGLAIIDMKATAAQDAQTKERHDQLKY